MSNANAILRRGGITEIVGRLSSGRTSLLLACLRGALATGGVAALVDADGAFDPESAEAAGIEGRRLLWVRCAGRRDVALRATDLLVRCPGFILVMLDVGETAPVLSLATAYRLKLAVRRADTALVIVGRQPIAGASASLVVETVPRGVEWIGWPGVAPGSSTPTRQRLVGASTEMRVRRAQGAPRVGEALTWRWRAR